MTRSTGVNIILAATASALTLLPVGAGATRLIGARINAGFYVTQDYLDAYYGTPSDRHSCFLDPDGNRRFLDPDGDPLKAAVTIADGITFLF